MSILFSDLRYALRSLFRQPVFTGVVVLVLALGIGANTAVFSVVEAVLLRPLPYPQPDRIAFLRETAPLYDEGSVSLANYLDWRMAQRGFTDLSIVRRNVFNFSLPSDGATPVEPEKVYGAEISANYLSILGSRPILGRDFTVADDTPGAPKVALISDRFWRRCFNADRTVIKRHVILDNVSYEIVGVLSPTLAHPRLTDILVPLADVRRDPATLNRDNHPGFSVMGRLRPGVTLKAAADQINAVSRELERRYPATNADRHVNVRLLLDATVGDYRQMLYLLLGSVGCVLLIACANVANLQLARASGRTKELAVRAALGAGRGRIIRQLLTESAVLGVLGGILGLLVALWAMDAITALSPQSIPRFHEVRLDWSVLVFATLTALGTGVLVGLWPAWRVSGVATMAVALHEGGARGSTGGGAQVRARSLLVVVQVALALVLLTGAGLALQSFQRMRSAPLGFQPEGLLTMSISLPAKGYEGEKITRFYARLLEGVRALPGVASAACGVNTPFDDTDWENKVHLTGTPPDRPGEEPASEDNYVSPGYFNTMGMPILRGRDFDGRDVADQGKTALVDESFVQKFFSDKEPIGQHIDDTDPRHPDAPPITIIGVVPRTLNDNPVDAAFLGRMSQVHYAAAQNEMPNQHLMVRVASGDPRRLVPGIRDVVRSLDPTLPVADITTMRENIANRMVSERLTMVLLGTFATLALLLASVGLYGVMALGVTQRTRELGIRLALGAQRGNVLGLVLREGFGLVSVGLLVGLGAAWGLGRLLATVLYGVQGSDPLILGGVSAVLAGAALLACWLPARRATRVDPLVALREE